MSRSARGPNVRPHPVVRCSACKREVKGRPRYDGRRFLYHVPYSHVGRDGKLCEGRFRLAREVEA